MTTNGATPTNCFAWRLSSSMKTGAKRLLAALAAALFPPRCALCLRALSTLEVVCSRCEASLPSLDGSRCRRCGAPVDDPSIDLCFRCGTVDHAVDCILSLGPYRGHWGRLIRAFKFEHEIALGRWLGSRLAQACSAHIDVGEVDAITFVPMTPQDKRQRGFNQAEVLARSLARRLHLPVRAMLIKTRDTALQSQLSAAERKINLRDAFGLLPSVQEQVLLVDDIYTTGATVEECARTLKRGGARSVVVVTVARA